MNLYNLLLNWTLKYLQFAVLSVYLGYVLRLLRKLLQPLRGLNFISTLAWRGITMAFSVFASKQNPY